MFSRLPRLAIVAALACSIGLHWAFFQSVAWTTMLADNLRATALVEAVQRTFDGNHPCRLCKAISAAKKSEQKAEFPPLLKKFECWHQTPHFVFVAPAHFRLLSMADTLAASLTHPPGLPPPKALLA